MGNPSMLGTVGCVDRLRTGSPTPLRTTFCGKIEHFCNARDRLYFRTSNQSSDAHVTALSGFRFALLLLST